MRGHASEADFSNLGFGDLIEVDWLDASEASGRLDHRARFDTPVRSVGFFLGVRGKRAKHVVIAKEVIESAKAYHYNVIPVSMVERVRVHARNLLDVETKRVLKKFVEQTMPKLKKREGWAYADGQDKKLVY